MAQTDVRIIEFKGNAKDLIAKIDEINTHSQDLDKSLIAVLSHLQQIEKQSLGNVTNNIQNAAKDRPDP